MATNITLGKEPEEKTVTERPPKKERRKPPEQEPGDTIPKTLDELVRANNAILQVVLENQATMMGFIEQITNQVETSEYLTGKNTEKTELRDMVIEVQKKAYFMRVHMKYLELTIENLKS